MELVDKSFVSLYKSPVVWRGQTNHNRVTNTMNERFNNMASSESWQVLVHAARRALKEAGYAPRRLPGRGRANIWEIEEGGQPKRVSVRTTRDRQFAFPPMNNGTKWKTLSDADIVVVASVDDPDDPSRIEVYRFDANEVRERFDAAYKERIEAGRSEPDNFGMWVKLDADTRGLPGSVGSGLASKHEPIAVYPLDQLIGEDKVSERAEGGEDPEPVPDTIAEIMLRARERIALLSGVSVEAVKLSCAIEA